MLPSGEVVSNCEFAADHWVVNDPSKPHCPQTGVTTKRPLITPPGGSSTTHHKDCASSLCELIKDRCPCPQPGELRGLRDGHAPPCHTPLSANRSQGRGMSTGLGRHRGITEGPGPRISMSDSPVPFVASAGPAEPKALRRATDGDRAGVQGWEQGGTPKAGIRGERVPCPQVYKLRLDGPLPGFCGGWGGGGAGGSGTWQPLRAERPPPGMWPPAACPRPQGGPVALLPPSSCRPLFGGV